MKNNGCKSIVTPCRVKEGFGKELQTEDIGGGGGG